MNPLLKWGVFPGILHNFLGNDTTPEGGHWRELCPRVEGSFADDFLVDFFYAEFIGCFRCLVQLLSDPNDRISLLSVTEVGELAVVATLVRPNRAEGKM